MSVLKSNRKEIIHCLCSLDSEGKPIPLRTKNIGVILTPPTTPEDTVCYSVQKDKTILLSSSPLLKANIDVQSRPLWNMLNAAASQTSDFDQQVCIESYPMKDSNADKLFHSYIIKVLNPLFESSSNPFSLPPVSEQAEMWEDYIRMNRAYAETIAEICTENDLVWIHGHELLLVPQFLRPLLPDAKIGLMLYSRFPNRDYLSKAYGYRSIVKSMLMLNYFGFKTEMDAIQFSLACMEFPTTVPPPKERIGIYPNIIDYNNLGFTPSVEERTIEIREMFSNKKIIYSRDSNTTNVYRIIAAFAQLLFRDPFLKYQLILIIHVCPSTVPLEELKSVPELVRQVNQLHISDESVPIHFYHQEMDKNEQLALMSASGLGLFLGSHPSIDIASQEFLKCQREECSPFIVSSSSHLLSAIEDKDLSVVDSETDVNSLADIIYETLVKSETKNRRIYEALETYIADNSATISAHRFIQALKL